MADRPQKGRNLRGHKPAFPPAGPADLKRPKLQEYVISIIAVDSRQRGLGPTLLRGFLALCASLYEFGLEIYLLLERIGLRWRTKLRVPVVSVGNVTVGGTGKTPMSALLCQHFKKRGLRAALLSRGHGRSSGSVRVVSDPDGNVLLPAAEAGDEPVLLARLCPGVPVIVGKDRRQSAREAQRRWPIDVFVLDDGFQYWQLDRSLDIVLIDAKVPFDNGYSLPRGLLREPARHLRRAGIVVATRADRLDTAGRASIMRDVRDVAPGILVHFGTHLATGLMRIAPGSYDPARLDTLAGVDVVALSAIAQPSSFQRSLLEATECRIVREIRFDDHHSFTDDDVAFARSVIEESNAGGLVMTEKDAVKWPIEKWTSSVPVYALRITMQLSNEEWFIDEVIRRAKINMPSLIDESV